MARKILILGVGNAQVDAILYCKRSGHEVFTISYRDEGPGRQYADHFDVVNIVDKQAVLNHAINISTDLVYSVGSDVAMPTIGYVSQRLGIPIFVDEGTAEILQNKGRFRRYLKEHGLNAVPFTEANSPDDLATWKTFPAIIKPVDSQGQRGVFKASNINELTSYFEKSISFSQSGNVIVEQFIDGPEISVNAFIINGLVVYGFITDRYVVKDLPGGIVKGHGIPANIEQTVRDRALSLVRNVIDALKIRNGPVYFQMKYTKDNVYVIEATPRLDGCHIWRLIKLKYGVDLLALSFQLLESPSSIVFSEKQPYQSIRKEALNLNFFLQKPGTLCHQTKNQDNDVLYKEWYYSNDEIIRPINGYAEKTGYEIRISS